MTNKLDVPKEHARLNKQRDETIPLATKEKRLLIELLHKDPVAVEKAILYLRGLGIMSPRKH